MTFLLIHLVFLLEFLAFLPVIDAIWADPDALLVDTTVVVVVVAVVVFLRASSLCMCFLFLVFLFFV